MSSIVNERAATKMADSLNEISTEALFDEIYDPDIDLAELRDEQERKGVIADAAYCAAETILMPSIDSFLKAVDAFLLEKWVPYSGDLTEDQLKQVVTSLCNDIGDDLVESWANPSQDEELSIPNLFDFLRDVDSEEIDSCEVFYRALSKNFKQKLGSEALAKHVCLKWMLTLDKTLQQPLEALLMQGKTGMDPQDLLDALGENWIYEVQERYAQSDFTLESDNNPISQSQATLFHRRDKNATTEDQKRAGFHL